LAIFQLILAHEITDGLIIRELSVFGITVYCKKTILHYSWIWYLWCKDVLTFGFCMAVQQHIWVELESCILASSAVQCNS